ncbi:potassium/sodium hyperpolarization-activated cyclic nucleotide-gated channel 4 [Panthera pardus]|uniref:Potassium/sodium hyperpolarization-activated cyclic nucleotide-gated channel 4 n=1 Tax=Panthera pardus TaxID=9691 RepID=A0A9W2UWG6_PANPR|nr:potassium/sodium hyperpolarization-activated cyclic nucleotide-gated channel 4 [Panthera pardus]XP_053750513.1 potassium/sodium hyperpolarization-activated cyclic nucleotide-gated channel 4 [Panthera pardus]
MVSSWVHPLRARLSDPSRCPSTPKSTSCADARNTPTGTLGRGPILTFHSLCILPSSLGAPPVQFSHCASGAQTPPPLPGGPGHFLCAPSQPLSQGFPQPPGNRRLLLPSAWRAQHHQPVRQTPAFRCSPPGVRRLSAHSYPQPLSIPVSPRRRLLDCSRCCRHRRPVAAAAAREGASQREREGGGGSPLPSARPLLSLLSGPLPYAPLPPRTAPAPSSPPAPPGQPQGATRARPRVTRATGRASSNLQWLFWACPDWVFPGDLGVLEPALESLEPRPHPGSGLQPLVLPPVREEPAPQSHAGSRARLGLTPGGEETPWGWGQRAW